GQAEAAGPGLHPLLLRLHAGHHRADGLPYLHPGQHWQAGQRRAAAAVGRRRRVLHHRQHLQPQEPAAGQILHGEGAVRAHQLRDGDRDLDRGREEEARSYRHRGAHRHRSLPGSGPRAPVLDQCWRRHDQRGQPGWQQPPGPRLRTARRGGTGGRRQPPLLDQYRQLRCPEANTDCSNPHVIVSGHLSDGVAVDASHLYWTAIGEGVIYEANLDGTNPQAIISGQSGPWGVAVDASQLYWTNPVAGTIWAANLDGSSPHVLLALQDNPAGVAVGGIPGPSCTGPTPMAAATARSIAPTLTAPARVPSSPARTPRPGWRSAPPACTGPTPTAAR